MSNVLDFLQFRKKKKEEKGEDPRPVTAEITLPVNDRCHYVLRSDGTLMLMAGNTPTVKQATREEIDLLRHAHFLQARVAELLAAHAPWMLYDDYITEPYIDWDAVCKMQGGAADAWNAQYQDHPEIIMARKTHVLIEEVRKQMPHVSYSNRVGLMVSDEIKHGKIIKSEDCPVMLFIAGPDDLQDKHIKASFKTINPSSKLGSIRGGWFDIEFHGRGQMLDFVTRFLAKTHTESLYVYLRDIVALHDGKMRIDE